MRIRERGKTVESPMEINLRRVERLAEEERGVPDIAISVEKWVTRLPRAHRRKTSVSDAGG
ncbi:hypothetical protein A2U01_0090738 [Trifolium medium]|uniref:Uncharacterized protein n=1 Tax=Trifolium medium TaxID=97028 RepID=A0A392UAR1_9FABA|nr:hypothetical protein [Trifolium medium]